MLNWLLVSSLIPLGHLSGGNWKSGLFSPITGLVFGLLFGVYDYWLIGFALAGWLSEKPSPAADSLGAITDGHGTYKDYLNLAKRGLISACFYLPLWLVADTYPMLAYVISWPLSAYIGRLGNAWRISEMLRYFLVGLVIIGNDSLLYMA